MAAPNATAKMSQIRMLFVCPIKVGIVRWPWAELLPANSMNAKKITAQKQTTITIGMIERAIMTENAVPTKKEEPSYRLEDETTGKFRL